MSTSQEKEIELLSRLRVPLLFGVVFIHSNCVAFLPEGRGLLTAFNAFMKVWNPILELMVPTFFFISGYLFFRSGLLTVTSFRNKLKARARSLLIPYLIWNIIGFLLAWIKSGMSVADPAYQQAFTSVWNVLMGFFAMPHTGAPYDMPLWFIRNLMVIVLLTPVINLLFRYLKFGAICVILAIVVMTASIIPFEITSSFWYFSLGASIPLLKLSLNADPKKFPVVALMFVALLMVYISGHIISALVFNSLGIFFLIFAAAWISDRSKVSENVDRSVSFFVYAFHGLYAFLIDRLIIRFFPPDGVSFIAFIDYFLAFLIISGISFACYKIGKKVCPGIIRIMCGNR